MTKKTDERRLVKVIVSNAVMSEFFIESARAFQVSRGLPRDAKIIDVEMNKVNGQITLTVISNQFALLKKDQEPPVFPSVQYTAFAVMPDEPEEEKTDILVPKPKIIH